MENKIKYFGINIKWWRKNNKVSQTEFAKLIGKKTSVVSAYENGISIPSLGIITNIAGILGFTVNDIMYSDLSKNTPNKDDGENGNLNSNLIQEKITIKTEKENNPEVEDLKIHISTTQFRIQQVKDLIKVLADNYKFNNDESKLYSCYLRWLKYLSFKDLEDFYLTESDIDKLKKYEDKVSKLQLAIYEDLFNITYVYNILMAK